MVKLFEAVNFPVRIGYQVREKDDTDEAREGLKTPQCFIYTTKYMSANVN